MALLTIRNLALYDFIKTLIDINEKKGKTMKFFTSVCASLLLILSTVTSVAHAHNCYGSYENTPNQATDDSRQHTEKPDATKREGNKVQD